MTNTSPPIRLHEDGALFRAALSFTAAETGFPARLLENVSKQRLEELRGQVDGRLKPVLRPRDCAAFDLNRAFALVLEMAKAVGV